MDGVDREGNMRFWPGQLLEAVSNQPRQAIEDSFIDDEIWNFHFHEGKHGKFG